MAPPAAAGGGAAQPQRQQQGGGIGQTISGIIRIAVFWYFASKFFAPKRPADPSQPHVAMSNLFQKGEPLNLKHNGTLYAHVFFARSGYPPDPNDPEYQPQAAFESTQAVVTYLPKSKSDKRRSLLGNAKGVEEVELLAEVVDNGEIDSKDEGPVEWVSYWKPNITINLVEDFTRYVYAQCLRETNCCNIYAQNAVPSNIAPHLNIEPTDMNYANL